MNQILILLACVISLYSQCQIYYQYDVYGNMKKRLYSCPFLIVNDEQQINEDSKNLAGVEGIEDEEPLSDKEGSLSIFLKYTPLMTFGRERLIIKVSYLLINSY